MIVGLELVGQEVAPQVQPRQVQPSVAGRMDTSAAAAEGEVTLLCGFDSDGSLKDCVVVSETPPDQGLRQSALATSERARLSPSTVERLRADSRADSKVRFTLRFPLVE